MDITVKTCKDINSTAEKYHYLGLRISELIDGMSRNDPKDFTIDYVKIQTEFLKKLRDECNDGLDKCLSELLTDYISWPL